MSLTATGKPTGPRPLPKTGMTTARCIQVIDLGTQTWHYNNKENSAHKVRFTMELPSQKHVFDEEVGPMPFVLSEEFTVSTSPKSNMRPFLESWMGRALKPEEVEALPLKIFLGKMCMINVVHNPSKKDPKIKYANIGAITPPMKEFKWPPAINPLVYFEIGMENQFEVFDAFPEFIQKKIASSPEWAHEENKKENFAPKNSNSMIKEEDEENDNFEEPEADEEAQF